MERSCRQIGIKEAEQLSFPPRIKCGMTSLDKGIDSCLRRNDNEGKVFSDE